MGRRGFLELSGATAAAALGGGTLDVDGLDPSVEGHGLLVGPEDAKPPAGGAYLSKWDEYNFVYLASDTGFRYRIQTGGEWETLPTNYQTSVSSDYTTSGERVILANATNITLTLSTDDAVLQRQIVVKDNTGTASGASPVTIETEGSETIDGTSSVGINGNYEAIRLEWTGLEWSIVGNYQGSGSL